jgi:thiol-disulfide isomerase/thioredoxin
MKNEIRLGLLLGATLSGLWLHGFTPSPKELPAQDVVPLPLGAVMPSFKLPDMDGQWVSSSDFDAAEVLVILFICNHCPTAQAYEQRIIDFVEEYRERNVSLIAVTPNSTLGLLLEECGYSDLNDSFEEMKLRAEYRGYNFPYLYDGDDHAMSLQFGPATTPEVYVFDRDRRLQYAGRIDAHEKPGTGHAEDLRQAVDALLDGRTPALQRTQSFGCSVKWSWKLDWTRRVNEEWAAQQVEVQDLDTPDLAALLTNDSGKLRLINLWATWCAPCVAEYPGFVETHRMYRGRDFEFVSISMDRPEHREKVRQFLQKQQSALTNYLFTGSDRAGFMKAFDPDWRGSLPYTILVEPGGRVVWRYEGPVDFLALRRVIVDHPMIGRYF